MPFRGAFPTIHTNLWNPVASCRPCVISPHLRIAPAPEPGAGGIGMFRLLRHGTGRRVLPRKKANPAFQSQLINPACEVAPLKSGLALLLRMERGRMFARHLRAAVSLPPLSSTGRVQAVAAFFTSCKSIRVRAQLPHPYDAIRARSSCGFCSMHDIPTVIHPGCFMASGTAAVGGERYGCRIADRIFPQSIRSTAFRQPYAFAFFRKFINYVDA